MKIFVNGVEINLHEGAIVEDALMKAGINLETVLVKRRGGLCAETDILEENDVLETVNVISGG